ncbi:MAG: adenylate/guanylate cyclase domain-containing protein [Pseudomonadota bacterium]
MQVQQTALLLADISDSMSLYTRVGDAEAARRITERLNRLERLAAALGGTRLRSRGDDLLCVFESPAASFRAACDMLAADEGSGLPIHGALNFGEVATKGGDVFGDVLNTAARLAAKANPGEFLVTEPVVAGLTAFDEERLLPLDRLSLRGKSLPTTVFILQSEGDDLNTRIPALGLREDGAERLAGRVEASRRLRMQYRDCAVTCAEGDVVTIGRAPACEILISRPWVSRRHAVISLVAGLPRLKDRSASGTFVAVPGQQPMLVRRETVVLPEQGVISPAVTADSADAEPVSFEVLSAPG